MSFDHEVESVCRVILIGMMGSGKSTIGRLLSQATAWPYVDNDELVHRHSGQTAREILAADGRAALREAEASAMRLGLELPAPVIIGVAAGTILDPANRDAMRAAGIAVWLRATVETLVGRAMDADHRPFVDTAGEPWLRETATERAPLYASVADLTVDTDVATPDESVAKIRGDPRIIDRCYRA